MGRPTSNNPCLSSYQDPVFSHFTGARDGLGGGDKSLFLSTFRFFKDLNSLKNSYKKAKARYERDISDLVRRKTELESRDSEFFKYVKYGFSLLKDLPEYYLKADIAVKQRIISSIFPQELIFEEKKYRTGQLNEVLALLTSNINHLGISQNKKAIKKDGLLHRASPRGIEPLLQE